MPSVALNPKVFIPEVVLLLFPDIIYCSPRPANVDQRLFLIDFFKFCFYQISKMDSSLKGLAFKFKNYAHCKPFLLARLFLSIWGSANEI